MAIFQILSGNQDLSFVIQKNPANPMTIKGHKAGQLFGFFPKRDGKLITNEYIIYFADASDEVSYKVHESEQFEYLTASKYNNARFINDAIQEMLHSARESKGDSFKYDSVSEQEIIINLCETEYKSIDIFRRHFVEISIEDVEISKNNYRLSFKSTSTLSYLLKIVNVFSIFAALNSEDFIYIEEHLCGKYVRLIQEIDAPYFIRYLMKVRMLREGKRFEMFKDQLQDSETYKINMLPGDSHVMRMNWIRDQFAVTELVNDGKNKKTVWNLRNNFSMIDIGAGIDYRYIKMFAPLYKELGITYYAIEKDPDAIARIHAGLRNRELEDTVELFESIEEFIKYHDEYLVGQTFNIICTEVLEHNEYEEAKKITKNIISKIKYDKFVITLPNADFNQFYGIEGFRHLDHKWEATIKEMNELANFHIKTERFASIVNVGDIVNNIPVSWGLILN